jgi:hypothetical protein
MEKCNSIELSQITVHFTNFKVIIIYGSLGVSGIVYLSSSADSILVIGIEGRVRTPFSH